MCGRFVFLDYEKILDLTRWHWSGTDPMPWSYNIAPTNQVAAVTNEKPDEIQSLTWWLYPHWRNDGSQKYATFNARSESLTKSRLFAEPFKKRRCIILANGWYEWTGTKGNKQPHYITMPDRPYFYFAGLWNNSHIVTEDRDEIVPCCTIITCPPHPQIEHLHNRMPAILRDEDLDLWLSSNGAQTNDLQQLLSARRDDRFDFWPVRISGNMEESIRPIN